MNEFRKMIKSNLLLYKKISLASDILDVFVDIDAFLSVDSFNLSFNYDEGTRSSYTSTERKTSEKSFIGSEQQD